MAAILQQGLKKLINLQLDCSIKICHGKFLVQICQSKQKSTSLET